MMGKNKQSGQMSFLFQTLKEQLNPRHPLYQLTGEIDWKSVEADFQEYYIDFGRPAKPVRLMVSLLILKQLHNLSDESVVDRWVENPYFQYFSGETHFQWSMPCDPSDLVHFRHRVGKEGIEKIFRLSVGLQGKDAQQKCVSIDTTVQEKNITFPTDLKLAVRIIAKCRKMAEKQGIPLRQSYKRTVKQHMLNQRFKDHPKNKKKALASGRKIKTIAPGPPKSKDSAYRKQQARIRFRRRAAIEPIFGHTKQDHRMARNYLKRFVGDEINALMAASAFNFRRWLRKVKLLPDFLADWVSQYLLTTIRIRFDARK